MRILFALAFSFLLTRAGLAQSPELPDTTIDASTRTAVIAGVLRRLDEGYVFPDKAAAMKRAIQSRVKRGAYDGLTSARAFADSLTHDLRSVSHDLHLEVSYQRRPVRDEVPDAEPSPEERRERDAFGQKTNFGLERAERLSGNVGYLEIRSFNFDAAAVDSALTAAMNFLARTDALIIDVRRNSGGEPSMVAAVCSYFLPPNRLINRFYWKPQNRWDEFRTSAVRGLHYGMTRPVYVLTSDGTFSGAEEFAYDVQTQKRGEVVGDTTGGGAHPGGLRRVTDHFGVWVPSGRAVNPVTGTNWEGTGVRPDVPVPAEDALRIAHLRALDRLLGAERDPERQATLRRAIAELRDSKVSTVPRPAVIGRAEGERRFLRNGTAPLLIKVDPVTTGSRHFVLGSSDLPPGDAIRVHRHLQEDELILVTRGTGRVQLGKEHYTATAGATVFIPQGTCIALENTGRDTLTNVFIFSAPGFEKALREVSSAEGAPPKRVSPADRAAAFHRGHAEAGPGDC